MNKTHESENARGHATGLEIARQYGPQIAADPAISRLSDVEDTVEAIVDALVENHIRDIESAGSFDPEHESDLYVAQHSPANFTQSSVIVVPGIHSDMTDLGESFAHGLAEGLTSGVIEVVKKLQEERGSNVVRPQFGRATRASLASEIVSLSHEADAAGNHSISAQLDQLLADLS